MQSEFETYHPSSSSRVALSTGHSTFSRGDTMKPIAFDSHDYSDEQLLRFYCNGETRAFESLVRRYRDELIHFLVRFTGDMASAEDVFQDTFLQVHVSREQFDSERNFRSWLFTIGANKARDYLRKRKRIATAELQITVDDEGIQIVNLLESGGPSPASRFEHEATGRDVRDVVEGLPELSREVLLLAYFHRFTYEEIAEMLDVRIGTVRSRLHRAVGTFAREWKKLDSTSAR